MNPTEAFAISLLAKATVIFFVGATVGFFLRNRSASMLRTVWALTLAAAIGLPIGMFFTPAWRVAVIPADNISVAPISNTAQTAVEPQSSMINAQAVNRSEEQEPGGLPTVRQTSGSALPEIPVFLAAIWLAGIAAVLGRMALGIIGLNRVARRSSELMDAEWQRLLYKEASLAGVTDVVRLLSSGDVSTPLTFGFRSPKIILPEESAGWHEAHRAVVIRHEMAHIASADAGACLVAGLAAAIYWFHPMVWIAAARLRRAQERACDDRVLTLGVAPADYAGHLLEVARSAREMGMPGFVSVAMARPSQLEGRLLAVLNESNDRATLTSRSRAAGFAGAVGAVFLLSAFSPVQRSAEASGTVTTTDVAEASPATPVGPPARVIESSLVSQTTATKNNAGDSVVDKTITVKPGGTLLLDLETGAGLTIKGSKDSRIHMRASLGGPDWQNTTVELVPDDRGARLVMRYQAEKPRRSSSHHIDLTIPEEYSIRLKSAGGGMTLTDVSGEFTGSTGGGNLRIERANGSASLSTGGGSVSVSSSNLDGSVSTGGGSVVIQTTNGNLRGSSGSGNVVVGRNGLTFASGSARDGLRGSDGKTYISKSGGTVSLGNLDGGADINTGGGRITIAGANGDVKASTGGGDIRVGSVSGTVDLSTGAGDVSVAVTGASSNRVKVSSGNGKVIVTVPSDVSASLDLETAYTEKHGRTRILSDWDVSVTETSEWDSSEGTPRRYVRSRTTINGGRGGVIRVRTINGDIVIRRGN
ncbi:MAG: M56 family metallopeptidase [Gemmatimonadales bacterium]